jgi:hypothetical protein
VDDTNGPASEADLERLAARVAMLASDEGEADNAGRAVSLLARRIGLTGGDLKRIFLAGAATATGPGRSAAELVDGLEHEVATLRQSVRLLDADARRAAAERDSLHAEIGALQARLYRARTVARGWGVAGGLAVAALMFTTVLLLFGGSHAVRRSDPAVASAGPPPVVSAAPPPGVFAGAPPGASVGAPPGSRGAVIRQTGAVLFREPDRAVGPLAIVPGGTRVHVRRLVWKALIQWVEIEVPGGGSGYVLTTEVDLF